MKNTDAKELALITAVILQEDILSGSLFQTFDKAYEIATEFIKIHPEDKNWEGSGLDYDETIIDYANNYKLITT